jgi:hypothetical protein
MGDDRAALHLLGSEGGRQHAGLSVEKDGIALWRHDAAGNIESGANTAIKAGPGLSVHGDVVEPLFRKHE